MQVHTVLNWGSSRWCSILNNTDRSRATTWLHAVAHAVYCESDTNCWDTTKRQGENGRKEGNSQMFSVQTSERKVQTKIQVKLKKYRGNIEEQRQESTAICHKTPHKQFRNIEVGHHNQQIQRQEPTWREFSSIHLKLSHWITSLNWNIIFTAGGGAEGSLVAVKERSKKI